VEETIYSADSHTIHEWIKANPNKLAYHTRWGSYDWKSLHILYIIHVFFGAIGIVIWATVDEAKRNRRR